MQVQALFYGGPWDMTVQWVEAPAPVELRIPMPPRVNLDGVTSADPADWMTEGWVAEYQRVNPDGPAGEPRYVWRRPWHHVRADPPGDRRGDHECAP